MQRHQQLGSQRAVVDVPGLDEERAQELEHHVVQPHAVADHVHDLLNDLPLTSDLRTAEHDYQRQTTVTEHCSKRTPELRATEVRPARPVTLGVRSKKLLRLLCVSRAASFCWTY